MSSYNIQMIFAVLALTVASTVWAQPDLANMREVGLLENHDSNPGLVVVPGGDQGVAFPPGKNSLIKLPEEVAANQGPEAAKLVLIADSGALGTEIDLKDPNCTTSDPSNNAPFYLVSELCTNKWSLLINTEQGLLNVGSVIGVGAPALPVPEIVKVLGVTYGKPNLYVMYMGEQGGPELVKCKIGPLRPGQAHKRAIEKAKCNSFSLDAVVDGGTPRGIAWNPQDDHLYVFIPNKDEIVKMTTTGGLVDRREVDLDLTDLKAVTFARSTDGTDDNGIFNMVVMTGGTDTGELTEYTQEP